MRGSLRAELLKLTKRPAMWVLFGVWMTLSLVFGYVFPYFGALDSGAAVPGAQVVDGALPDALVASSVQDFPMFAAGMGLLLGALGTGAEYGWDTWKVLFTSGARRVAVLVGKMSALVLVMLAIVLATFVASAVASAVVASAVGAPADWPPATDIVVGIGAGWLMLAMWCLLGVFLAIVLRSTAPAAALGLIWVLVLENLLRISGSLLGVLDFLQRYLPGTSAGAVAAALGVPVEGEEGATLAVTEAAGGTTGAFVMAGYLLVFVLASMALVHRRDV